MSGDQAGVAQLPVLRVFDAIAWMTGKADQGAVITGEVAGGDEDPSGQSSMEGSVVVF